MAKSIRITNFKKCLDKLSERHFERIIDCLKNNKDPLYTYSYSSLLLFVQNIKKKRPATPQSTILALAHMVYGWMPTMLDNIDYKGINFDDLFDKLKSDRNIDISTIAKLTNGSVVGASKLLHCVHPDKYPIFDSRVYRGIIRIVNILENEGKKLSAKNLNIRVPNDLSKKIDFYEAYQKKLSEIPFSKKLKSELKKKGYINKDASNMRALEICLYAIGAGMPKESEKDARKEKRKAIIEQLENLLK